MVTSGYQIVRENSPRALRRAPWGRIAEVIASAALALALSDCTYFMTREEGDALAALGRKRDERIRTLEGGLTEDIDAARVKLAELQAQMQEAMEKLSRNDADVEADLRQLERQVNGVQGHVAELTQSLETLRAALDALTAAQAAGPKPIVDEAQVPGQPGPHYEMAVRAHKQGDYPAAGALFTLFTERYPTHENVDKAHYWVGDAYLKENSPARALGAFRRVITDYPKSEAVDRSLLGMARSFMALRACSDAKSALGTLLKRKPNRALQREAQDLANQIGRLDKSRCVS